MSKVWFITGASKGLGLAFTEHLLKNNQKVVGTSRNAKTLAQESDNYLPLELNLSDEESVALAVQKTVKKFGRIDVLVNNAGYGQGGAVEEVSDRLARENFEVNVFGLLNVTRGVLPIMRKQKSGHVMNISSIGGFAGNFSGFGVYCGTKFAVAGITEGLKADLQSLGIHTTLIYPGYFRTEFLASGSFSMPDKVISDYKSAKDTIDHHVTSINKNQAGSPSKAAEAILKLSEMQNPPLHFFMGTDALEFAKNEMDAVLKEMNQHIELSQSTNI